MADAPSERARVRRGPQRADYDADTVHAIVDETLMAFVSLVEDGRPLTMPMMVVRAGDRLCLHGSIHSRLMQALADGRECCVSMALIDGLVMARSAFNHSVNYRSVVVFGRAQPVMDADDKRRLLKGFVDRLSPGRWEQLRPMTAAEIASTMVVTLALSEASAKIRTGPSKDPAQDRDWPVWAGVVPLSWRFGELEPEADLADATLPLPDLSGFRFGQ